MNREILCKHTCKRKFKYKIKFEQLLNNTLHYEINTIFFIIAVFASIASCVGNSSADGEEVNPVYLFG